MKCVGGDIQNTDLEHDSGEVKVAVNADTLHNTFRWSKAVIL